MASQDESAVADELEALRAIYGDELSEHAARAGATRIAVRIPMGQSFETNGDDYYVNVHFELPEGYPTKKYPEVLVGYCQSCSVDGTDSHLSSTDGGIRSNLAIDVQHFLQAEVARMRSEQDGGPGEAVVYKLVEAAREFLQGRAASGAAPLMSDGYSSDGLAASASGAERSIPVIKGFDELPSDLVRHVLEYLTGRDLLRAGAVCRAFRQLVADQQLWADLYRQRWPPPPPVDTPAASPSTAALARVRLRPARSPAARPRSHVAAEDMSTSGRGRYGAEGLDWRTRFWRHHWRDRYWAGGRRSLKTVSLTPVLEVRSMEWLEGGRTVVVGVYSSSTQGHPVATGRIYDVATGELVHVLGAPTLMAAVTALAVDSAPPSPLIVAASSDLRLRVYEARNGGHDVSLLRGLRGHTKPITAVRLAPLTGADSGTIASASADKSVRVWAPRGKATTVLWGHGDPVTCVEWTRTEATGRCTELVSGSADGRVKLWDPHAAKCLATLKAGGNDVGGGARGVTAIDVCQSECRVASGCEDGSVKVWDMRTKEKAAEVLCGPSHSGTSAVRWSPDGRLIVVGTCPAKGRESSTSGGGLVKVYDIRRVASESASGNGSRGSAGGGSTRDMSTHAMYGHPGSITALGVDSDRIVSACSAASLKVWTLRSGQLLHSFHSTLGADVDHTVGRISLHDHDDEDDDEEGEVPDQLAHTSTGPLGRVVDWPRLPRGSTGAMVFDDRYVVCANEVFDSGADLDIHTFL